MTWPLNVVSDQFASSHVGVAASRGKIGSLPWPALVLAFGLLAATGASLGLAWATLSLVAEPSSFFTGNQLSKALRNATLAAMIVGALLPCVAAVVWLLASRGRSAARLIQVVDVLSPLAISGVVVPLLDYKSWSQAQLTFLLSLAAVVLVTEHLVTRSLRSMPASARRWAAEFTLPRAVARWLPITIVLLASLAYATYFSYYTLLNHRRFQTSAFDLGINVNWCYNALLGDFFRSTVLFGPDGGHFVGAHAIYAVFLWLPFYAIAPGAEPLLIYQSAMIAIAAVPLYLFASCLVSRPVAVVVALGYLIFAPLHGPNFYDFHELPVALPFHFLLYYCIASQRYRAVPLLMLVLFAHREDLPVGVAIVGLFLLLTGARPRLGAGLALASAAFFVVNKFIIMPYYGSWWFSSLYKDLQPAGSAGYGPVVQTILINPTYFISTLLQQDKLIYALHMLVPLAFLPLRRPALMFLSIPGFFFTLMTTGYAPTISIAFQYTTHWIPYIFAATVIALKLLADDAGGHARKWGALCALALGISIHSTTFGAVIQRETFTGGFTHIQFEETAEERARYAGFRRLADKIPRDASVAATYWQLAHVAVRKDVYNLSAAHGDADYIIAQQDSAATSVLRDAFRRNRYGLVAEHDQTFFLFKKNHLTPENKQATARAKTRLGIR